MSFTPGAPPRTARASRRLLRQFAFIPILRTPISVMSAYKSRTSLQKLHTWNNHNFLKTYKGCLLRMYLTVKLAVMALFGSHPALSHALHASISPSNRTHGKPISSTALHRPSILRMDDDITCIDHPPMFRTHKVSLAICLPIIASLEARPDFKVNHVYGAHRKQERVNITPGPCIINLYPETFGGITAVTLQEIARWTKKVLEKCESTEEGGTHFIGIDWYLEVLGVYRRPLRLGI